MGSHHACPGRFPTSVCVKLVNFPQGLICVLTQMTLLAEGQQPRSDPLITTARSVAQSPDQTRSILLRAGVIQSSEERLHHAFVTFRCHIGERLCRMPSDSRVIILKSFEQTFDYCLTSINADPR